MAKKERDTELVRVKTNIKNKVAKAVIGTEYTIGSFFEAAAEEKLTKPKTKK